jgi:hypothetical protein
LMSIAVLILSSGNDSNVRREGAWGRISSPSELHCLFAIYVYSCNNGENTLIFPNSKLLFSGDIMCQIIPVNFVSQLFAASGLIGTKKYADK